MQTDCWYLYTCDCQLREGILDYTDTGSCLQCCYRSDCSRHCCSHTRLCLYHIQSTWYALEILWRCAIQIYVSSSSSSYTHTHTHTHTVVGLWYDQTGNLATADRPSIIYVSRLKRCQMYKTSGWDSAGRPHNTICVIDDLQMMKQQQMWTSTNNVCVCVC